MGMLISGEWSSIDKEITDGAYVRDRSARLIADIQRVSGEIAAHPGRFVLIASFSCPWSHRATIIRSLKQLKDLIPVHMAYGDRIEGYAVDGGKPWRVPGTDRYIKHLHELYALDDPLFTGRVTVPVLWDTEARRIVSNDSAQLMRLLDTVVVGPGDAGLTLAPNARKADIETLNQAIHTDLNDGVYRAGFARSQAAYDGAVSRVFTQLECLEQRLSQNRFLLGTMISESDWRLFPTLVRFDAIYHVLHRCCKKRLVDYPNLWAYARDLYAWEGICETVNLQVARTASYQNDTTNNPQGIVPVAPDADWQADPGRNHLGPATIARRDGEIVSAGQYVARCEAP